MFGYDLLGFALYDAKMLCVFEHAFHFAVVGVFIGLRPQLLHRRALALVEHTVLQRAFVCVQAHFAAECVDFAH